MEEKDHLAWVLRVNALDHTWVTLCKLANVPANNVAGQQFLYEPARISLYALGDNEHLATTFPTNEPGMIKYTSEYAENFMGMMLSEYEGEAHVRDRCSSLAEGYQKIEYAEAFDKCITKIREQFTPAEVHEALKSITQEGAKEIVSKVPMENMAVTRLLYDPTPIAITVFDKIDGLMLEDKLLLEGMAVFDYAQKYARLYMKHLVFNTRDTSYMKGWYMNRTKKLVIYNEYDSLPVSESEKESYMAHLCEALDIIKHAYPTQDALDAALDSIVSSVAREIANALTEDASLYPPAGMFDSADAVNEAATFAEADRLLAMAGSDMRA